MAFWDKWKSRKAVAPDVGELLERIDKLEKEKPEIIRVALQNSVLDQDIVTNSLVSTNSTVGTRYKTYDAQVASLALKAAYQDTWGCQFVNSIADMRGYFTIGNGFNVKTVDDEEKGEETKKFVEEFFKHNDINGATCQEWARNANIEGKFLGRLSVDKTDDRTNAWLNAQAYSKNPQIRVRLLPYTQHGYTVINEPNDYTRYIRVDYTDDNSKKVELLEPFFSYGKFGGLVGKVNESPPAMAAVLNELEDIGKAIGDWRKINHMFSAPTPVATFTDAATALAFAEEMDGKDWVIGKLVTLANGTFQYLMISAESYEPIEKEIVRDLQVVSGATGMPVQFLGMPDLLSNRATADNLLEQIIAAVNADRRIWKSAVGQLVRKAIQLANTELQAGLNPYAVEIDIVELSSLVLHRLTQVYLPLFNSKVITGDAVRDRIPDIDAEKEKAKLEQLEKQLMDMELAAADKMGQLRPDGSDGKVVKTSNNGGREV